MGIDRAAQTGQGLPLTGRAAGEVPGRKWRGKTPYFRFLLDNGVGLGNSMRFCQMRLHLMKSKILRAWVTDAALDYEGSLEIDAALMDRVGLLRFEKILVANIDNGERLETYAIPAERGSGRISLNGAAAHKGKVGDRLVIISFAEVEADKAAGWKPKTITLGADNHTVIKSQNT